MTKLPLSMGLLHFVGIGGIGMSGIAEIMHNLGYKVQGSDASTNSRTAYLQKLGIAVTLGHKAGNILTRLGKPRVQAVIVSSAIDAGNPEVRAAKKHGLPLVRRAEMLAELMRLKWSISVAGTHGKTTTTSLIASLLDAAALDPTVINGGIINAYGTNARLGKGNWMVAEADESDGTFTRLPSTVTVVTNINPEHLDHYGSFDALQRAFHTYVENTPFYGFTVMSADQKPVQKLRGKVAAKRVITFGFSPKAEIRGHNVGVSKDATSMVFDVTITSRRTGRQKHLRKLRLPMLGEHNVQNALGALGVGYGLDLPLKVLRQGLARFQGVKRRFTYTGKAKGIVFYDDYAHHPAEIRAVLSAARTIAKKKVVAIIQPHRYSRLHSLFDEFCTCATKADTVIVTPIYAAGETPMAKLTHQSLVRGLRAQGHRHVVACRALEDLPKLVAQLCHAGDMVLCLGAGSISTWAHTLPGLVSAAVAESTPPRKNKKGQKQGGKV